MVSFPDLNVSLGIIVVKRISTCVTLMMHITMFVPLTSTSFPSHLPWLLGCFLFFFFSFSPFSPQPKSQGRGSGHKVVEDEYGNIALERALTCKAILSNGHSFFLAMDCSIAVRKDCGLKKPDSQTTLGKQKSDVQLSNSLIRINKSTNHAARPDMDGYARRVHDSGTSSRKRALPNSSMSAVMVSSPYKA